MNILITGGCGFVGTNLSLYLKSKNLMFTHLITCLEMVQNLIIQF